ncbi:MAG: carbohydrate kinase [Bacteroidia bacterium]|nr:MAG: carbohydrate kinase [Bacteroidia bacterium]
MFTLGIDIGSSSVKVSILDLETGMNRASAFAPHTEMSIISRSPGWAEQDPEEWWIHVRSATNEAIKKAGIEKDEVLSIGISYQMHGLVMVDRNMNLLRDSIIWCDSRASRIGAKAFIELGENYCNEHLLNSPGNFTASKLKWVQVNEPGLYKKIYKIMLPGDYIAMKMTGSISTTEGGLSEGILWNIKDNKIADLLMDYYSIDPGLIPDLVPTFGEQGRLSSEAAAYLGLKSGTPVSYRAGDQPNNAFSLNVLEPGDIAATAGTSGVLYGVSNHALFDKKSRVNTFLHVNHSIEEKRLGVLFCLNGAGILYNWLRRLTMGGELDYDIMNRMAAAVEPGSDGLRILPFGNGAERMLENRNPGCSISGINFNIHNLSHLYRAGLEGIAYAFKYGIDILGETGLNPSAIRAGNANLFLSPVFREILSTLTGLEVQLYDTDGSLGAARAAACGSGLYKTFDEAFEKLEIIEEIIPDGINKELYESLYNNWYNELVST